MVPDVKGNYLIKIIIQLRQTHIQIVYNIKLPTYFVDGIINIQRRRQRTRRVILYYI